MTFCSSFHGHNCLKKNKFPFRSENTSLLQTSLDFHFTQATMANLETPSSSSSLTFSNFPEDVQLCILSFLTPSELISFSCTSKRFGSLCRSDGKLWYSMCDRRWGYKTQIRKWGNGKIQFKLLYKTLNRLENLIGFWRRGGRQEKSVVVTTSTKIPPLVFFEWGSSFIIGSWVSPSKLGNYGVVKKPFLWMGVSGSGESVNFLDPDCRFESLAEFAKLAEMGGLDSDLVSVSVSFMGKNHVVVEENPSFGSLEGRKIGFGRSPSSSDHRPDVNEVEGTSPGCFPDHLKLDVYQYFANRTSPSRDRASRRQRRWKWEPEHFVKIVNSAPTPSRPLQGLWKGICEDMSLDFYLVAYDDMGGIACRRVGDASERFSGYSPVFWTSNTTFIEPPFSCDEEYIYDSRIHLKPPSEAIDTHRHPPFLENEVVSRILKINSSYDLVILGSSVNPQHVEGRIWLYANGTFGFGFLRNNFIIDLKHIVLDGCLLDTM